MPEPRDIDLGRLAVARGLISPSQLDEALADLTARLERSENPTSDSLTLLTVLIARGWLMPSDVSALIAAKSAEPPPPDADLPPEVVQAMRFPDSRFGKYTIVRLLGTGGMGAVYLAWDNDLRRFIALKFLTVGTDDNIRRFLREAQTAARLNHPGIAQVYDAGTLHGRHYIAMEYVDGITLDTLPDSVRRGEIDKVVRVMRDVALAVDYAHSKGIIHRDLKPQNVMIDDLLKPHIMDFGLARAVTTDELRAKAAPARPITVTGTIVGTPNYVAPEQARGENERLDARTDVYGLGATLYAMATGSPPFNAATPLDTLMDVLQKPPAPPRAENAAVSRELETVILKCLAKEPADRYQTAREVADDLGRILAREPIRARPEGAFATAMRSLRTRPAVVALVVSSVLLAVAGCSLIIRELRLRAAERAEQIDREAREAMERERDRRRTLARQLTDAARVDVDRAERMLLVGEFSPAAFGGACDAAAALLSRALEADGMHVPAYVLRGDAYALADRLDAAIHDFTRALDLEPEHAPALQRRALARLHRACALRRGPRLLTALGSAASWHALRPSPETRAAFADAAADFARLRGPLAEGARHLAAGAPDAAIDPLSRADAQDADAHFFAGVAHFLARRPRDAEAAFTRAIVCRPHAAGFRAWRASARLELGAADAARDDLRSGLALAPDHPDLLLLSGEVDAVLRARPEDPFALARRAKRHLDAGRPAEALADLEQASRRRTDGSEAIHALRARAALATGSDAVAESAAAEAVRLGPDYGPGHAALAAARWKRGQSGPAREALDRALALDRADPDAHELEGDMRFAEGAKAGAAAAWERAASLDPARRSRLAPLIDKAKE